MRFCSYVTPASRRSLSRCWSYSTRRALVHINTEPLSALSWYVPRNSGAALAGQGPLLWAPSHGQQRIDNIWMRVAFMHVTKAVSGGLMIMGKILAEEEFTQITRAVVHYVIIRNCYCRNMEWQKYILAVQTGPLEGSVENGLRERVCLGLSKLRRFLEILIMLVRLHN